MSNTKFTTHIFFSDTNKQTNKHKTVWLAFEINTLLGKSPKHGKNEI